MKILNEICGALLVVVVVLLAGIGASDVLHVQLAPPPAPVINNFTIPACGVGQPGDTAPMQPDDPAPDEAAPEQPKGAT